MHDWYLSGGYSEGPADGGLPVWGCRNCGAALGSKLQLDPAEKVFLDDLDHSGRLRDLVPEEDSEEDSPEGYSCEEVQVAHVMES
jgi:hypothetical protein